MASKGDKTFLILSLLCTKNIKSSFTSRNIKKDPDYFTQTLYLIPVQTYKITHLSILYDQYGWKGYLCILNLNFITFKLLYIFLIKTN